MSRHGTLRGWAIGALAGLMLVGLAAPAAAIPVRNIKTPVQGTTLYLSASVFSPPTGVSCGAYYAVGIAKAEGAPNPFVRRRAGRMNVCQRIFDDGWSVGVLRVRFNVADLPIGNYVVCILARQTLTNGAVSSHTICRQRHF